MHQLLDGFLFALGALLAIAVATAVGSRLIRGYRRFDVRRQMQREFADMRQKARHVAGGRARW